MKRGTALALLGVVLLGMGALCATPGGRSWLKDLAAAQVDDVLDTLAVTQPQRRALEELKHFVAAQVDAKADMLRGLARCILHSRSRPAERFEVTLPMVRPLLQVQNPPRTVSSWPSRACSGNFLPPPRGAIAAEWRSCCSRPVR